MAVIRPKKLHPGDTIALVAPSSWCAVEDADKVKTELEKRGFRVILHTQCGLRDNMSAGTAQQRAAALNDVFADDAVDAIFALRGGYRAIHLLDKIDYAALARRPRIVMGYSDITSLLSAIHRQTGLVTFHGPTARGFGDLSNTELVADNITNNAALDFLTGNIPPNLFHDHPVTTLKPGAATGTLWGGNLQLLSALIEAGGDYHPSFDDAILVIEDIGEEIAKIDRQLGAWRLTGIFKRLRGLIVGTMTDVKDTPGHVGAFGYDLAHLLREHAAELDGPVVMNAPFGHAHPNYIFPVGVRATLDTAGGPRLTLPESPFAPA